MTDLYKSNCFDIDGIITDYPNCFLNFFNSTLNTNFSIDDLKLLKDSDFSLYSDIKNKYRLSKYKYSLPVNALIKDIINNLSGYYGIVILTTRPFEKYEEMYDNTYNWLINSGINFNYLEKKNFSSFERFSPIIHIDDELDHVYEFINHFTSTNFIIKNTFVDKVIGFENLDQLPLIIKHILKNSNLKI